MDPTGDCVASKQFGGSDACWKAFLPNRVRERIFTSGLLFRGESTIAVNQTRPGLLETGASYFTQARRGAIKRLSDSTVVERFNQ